MVSHQSQSSNLSNQSIDVKDLPSGIYFVRLEINGMSSVQKFIKQ
jgi:hypothetical protein